MRRGGREPGNRPVVVVVANLNIISVLVRVDERAALHKADLVLEISE